MDFTILGDWNSILHVNKCLAQSQPKDGRENEKILKYLKRNVRRGSKGGGWNPPKDFKITFSPYHFSLHPWKFSLPLKKTLPCLWPVLKVEIFLTSICQISSFPPFLFSTLPFLSAPSPENIYTDLREGRGQNEGFWDGKI